PRETTVRLKATLAELRKLPPLRKVLLWNPFTLREGCGAARTPLPPVAGRAFPRPQEPPPARQMPCACREAMAATRLAARTVGGGRGGGGRERGGGSGEGGAGHPHPARPVSRVDESRGRIGRPAHEPRGVPPRDPRRRPDETGDPEPAHAQPISPAAVVERRP